MYTNGMPCCDCMRGVIQSGIKGLVLIKEVRPLNDYLNSAIEWERSVARSVIMQQELGMEVRIMASDIIQKLELIERGENLLL